MRFVPRSVTVGFVNALAILIFLAQVPHLREGGIERRAPRPPRPGADRRTARGVTKVVPAPLIAIAVLTVLVVTGHVGVPTVGDQGVLPDSLPIPGLPSVPFSFETLGIIAPYSVALAAVGLLESLMTARLVDSITDTRSNKDRESTGQGIANVVTGFFGGMAGCAMIGQTMINVRVSGARTRLSTFAAGVFLLVLVVGLGGLVARIPMPALVAVMIIVSVSTFDWHSVQLATLRRMPRSETLIMVVTVVGDGRDREPRDRRRARRPHRDGALRAQGRSPRRRRPARSPRPATRSPTSSPASSSSPRTRSSSTRSSTTTTRPAS